MLFIEKMQSFFCVATVLDMSASVNPEHMLFFTVDFPERTLPLIIIWNLLKNAENVWFLISSKKI